MTCPSPLSCGSGADEGVEDLPALVEALEYLAETLGITAVWVGSPLAPPLLDRERAAAAR